MAGSDEDWIYRHRIMRRFVMVWAVWLITITVMAYLSHIGKVAVTDGVIIGAIVGILSLVIDFQSK